MNHNSLQGDAEYITNSVRRGRTRRGREGEKGKKKQPSSSIRPLTTFVPFLDFVHRWRQGGKEEKGRKEENVPDLGGCFSGGKGKEKEEQGEANRDFGLLAS